MDTWYWIVLYCLQKMVIVSIQLTTYSFAGYYIITGTNE